MLHYKTNASITLILINTYYILWLLLVFFIIFPTKKIKYERIQLASYQRSFYRMNVSNFLLPFKFDRFINTHFPCDFFILLFPSLVTRNKCMCIVSNCLYIANISFLPPVSASVWYSCALFIGFPVSWQWLKKNNIQTNNRKKPLRVRSNQYLLLCATTMAFLKIINQRLVFFLLTFFFRLRLHYMST